MGRLPRTCLGHDTMSYTIKDYRNGYVEFIDDDAPPTPPDGEPLAFITISWQKCGWIIRDERDETYGDPYAYKGDAIEQAKLWVSLP